MFPMKVLQLRQSIEKQLNKVESSNRFSVKFQLVRAVRFFRPTLLDYTRSPAATESAPPRELVYFLLKGHALSWPLF